MLDDPLDDKTCNAELKRIGNQVFFLCGKNQFNLANGLKATQVHDSDTPSPFS
jgi:hypothetical protein